MKTKPCRCLRCGYEWTPRVGNAVKPRACPACKSYRWDKPREPRRGE